MFLPSFRRLGAAVLAAVVCTAQALATWSIVVVDTRTGEICVASATCIENFNLRAALAILSAEAGGGAAQSFVSPISTRILMDELLALGVPPQEILDEIEAGDALFQSRQFGIVDLAGRAATFTGTQAGGWAGGVTGQVGDLVYAIQGNVLTGSPVVTEAEIALRNTPGDLGQRVMAAMEAAQAMGGDGRCSCDELAPESCGAPPSGSFKSAHVGFFLIARPGDEPFCDNFACAKGDLYLAINKAGLVAADPDVVFEIRAKYDQERLAWIGRPDAMLSEVTADLDRVSADAPQVVRYVLDLHDVDDNLLTSGGATVSLVHDPRSAGLATLQNVIDHQDGTYTVELLSGTAPGLDVLRFVVDDGIRPVTLWPPQTLLHQTPVPAPVEDGSAVAGLSGLGDLRTAFADADGLGAWAVVDRGQGFELLELERPAVDQAFTVAADVGIDQFALAQLHSLWVSADGLRMTLSAFDPLDGKRHLYSTSRGTTVEDFAEPTLLVDLDSGFGESDPVLSANELEIWFSTRRDGDADLWHATRLSPEARWFPPAPVDGLNTDADELAPVLADGDSRLLFARGPGSPLSGMWRAERDGDGSFPAAVRLAGIGTERAGRLPVALLADAAGAPVLWQSEPAGAGLRTVEAAGTRPGSLSLAPSELSLAAGGSLQFQLDAGSDFAGASYLLLGGFADGATVLPGTGVLPLARAPFSDALRALYGGPLLPDGEGVLDGAGQAVVDWTLPAGSSLPPQLLDRDLPFVFLARQASGARISSPAVLRLLP